MCSILKKCGISHGLFYFDSYYTTIYATERGIFHELSYHEL